MCGANLFVAPVFFCNEPEAMLFLGTSHMIFFLGAGAVPALHSLSANSQNA